jgi:long-chain acyl-CoA synthetase
MAQPHLYEIAETSGVEVTEEAIARIDTVRDLLRDILEAGKAPGFDPLAQPYAILDERQKGWLRPLGPLMNLTARTIYAFGRVLMRLLFRVRVIGRENLPNDRPWIMNAESHQLSRRFRARQCPRLEQLRQTTGRAGPGSWPRTPSCVS